MLSERTPVGSPLLLCSINVLKIGLFHEFLLFDPELAAI